MFYKSKRNKSVPELAPASQDRAYLQGRATVDLDAWERSVPLGPIPLIECGERSDLCPYQFGDDTTKAQRVAWLTGFYDEVVDQTELRVRRKLGLPEVNWTPPPEKTKVYPPKG
jgi:ribosome modulation factor